MVGPGVATGAGGLQCGMLVIGATSTSAVLFWVGVLIVLAVLGGLAMLVVRRRALGDHPDTGGDAGLMEQLRRMVERGDMTQAEFDQARRAVIDRARGVKPPPGADDAGA